MLWEPTRCGCVPDLACQLPLVSLGSVSHRVPAHSAISHSLADPTPPHTEEASDTSCWTESQTPHVCESQGTVLGMLPTAASPLPGVR